MLSIYLTCSPFLSHILVVCGSDRFLLLYLICTYLIMNKVEHLFIKMAICIPFWTVFSYPLPFILLVSLFSYSFLWVLCKLRKFALWFILKTHFPVCYFSFHLFIFIYLSAYFMCYIEKYLYKFRLIIFFYGSWAMIYFPCNKHLSSLIMSKVIVWSILAAITNYHSPGGWEVQNQGAGRFSVWREPPSWFIDGCLSSHGVFTWWKGQGSSLPLL